MKLTFFGYWRSSCSWRVRIALAMKQVPHTFTAVNLLAGEQHAPAWGEKNPTSQVPLFEIEEHGETRRLGQSMAMLDWLDARFPTPRLLPQDPWARAKALQLAEIVNSSIQPLQNLIILARIDALGGERTKWAADFNRRGLAALERDAAQTAGRFLVGDEVTVADLCLVPQLYSARRYGVDVSAYPRLGRIEAACAELPAFQAAHADRQPDATA